VASSSSDTEDPNTSTDEEAFAQDLNATFEFSSRLMRCQMVSGKQSFLSSLRTSLKQCLSISALGNVAGVDCGVVVVQNAVLDGSQMVVSMANAAKHD
jgi:hypothetical protein